MQQYGLLVEKSIGGRVHGQDILDPMRFSDGTCHTAVFRLLVTCENIKDTKIRAHLSGNSLQKAINEQNQGIIYIEKRTLVQNRHLYLSRPANVKRRCTL